MYKIEEKIKGCFGQPFSQDYKMIDTPKNIWYNKEKIGGHTMNNNRRKELNDIAKSLESINNRLEIVMDNEQSSFDNLPEGFQQTTKGDAMLDAVDNIGAANEALSEAIDNIYVAISAIEDATV